MGKKYTDIIHDAFKVNHVAKEYYRRIGREYDLEPARKQFIQDANIDTSLLKTVINHFKSEQIAKINKAK